MHIVPVLCNAVKQITLPRPQDDKKCYVRRRRAFLLAAKVYVVRTPNIRLRKHDLTVGYDGLVVCTSLCLSGTAHARLVPLAYGTGTQLVVFIDIVGSVIMSE
jgi:hypothetical protein